MHIKNIETHIYTTDIKVNNYWTNGPSSYEPLNIGKGNC